MGSIIGQKIDYNGVGALRGQRQIPSKHKPKYSPGPDSYLYPCGKPLHIPKIQPAQHGQRNPCGQQALQFLAQHSLRRRRN